eukprot:12677236-Ditylum_brightwellii.AAC.1
MDVLEENDGGEDKAESVDTISACLVEDTEKKDCNNEGATLYTGLDYSVSTVTSMEMSGELMGKEKFQDRFRVSTSILDRDSQTRDSAESKLSVPVALSENNENKSYGSSMLTECTENDIRLPVSESNDMGVNVEFKNNSKLFDVSALGCSIGVTTEGDYCCDDSSHTGKLD